MPQLNSAEEFFQMPPTTDIRHNELLKNLAALFKNPLARERLAKAIVAKDDRRSRPHTWRGASVASYYKLKYAEWLRPILDAMLSDGHNKLLLIKDNPPLNKDSLYLKVNQAFHYILDYLDESGKYFVLRESTDITKHRENGIVIGVLISFNESVLDTGHVAQSIDVDRNGSTWRNDMEQWLMNSSSGDKFERKSLMLLPEEVESVKELLDNLGDSIIYKVTQTNIIIRRM